MDGLTAGFGPPGFDESRNCKGCEAPSDPTEGHIAGQVRIDDGHTCGLRFCTWLPDLAISISVSEHIDGTGRIVRHPVFDGTWLPLRRAAPCASQE